MKPVNDMSTEELKQEAMVLLIKKEKERKYQQEYRAKNIGKILKTQAKIRARKKAILEKAKNLPQQ